MSKNNGSINIFEEGILVDTNISRWGAKQKLRADDLGLDGKELPDIFYLGHKKMIHHSNFKEINTVANEANIYLNQHSIPFPIHGVKFLPKSMVTDVIEKLNEFKFRYDELVNDFVDNKYDLAVKEIKKEFPDEWNTMKYNYPTKSQLKNKFSFDYQVYQLTLPNEKAGILSKDEIIAQRKKINVQVEEFAVIIFKQNSIDNILDMCDRFQDGLNFLNDKSVTKVIKELKVMFKNTDANDIRSDSKLMKTIEGQLSTVVKKMTDVNDYKIAVTSYKRKLTFK